MTSSSSAVVEAVPLVTLIIVESVRCREARSLLYLWGWGQIEYNLKTV